MTNRDLMLEMRPVVVSDEWMRRRLAEDLTDSYWLEEDEDGLAELTVSRGSRSARGLRHEHWMALDVNALWWRLRDTHSDFEDMTGPVPDRGIEEIKKSVAFVVAADLFSNLPDRED